ncbi:MAG: SRPBCC family protein [Bacteroidota bacterium]
MKTNIEKVFTVDQPIEMVWDFLSNPNKVVTCVPGASITNEIDDRNYEGTVSMKFGPVAAKYNGKILIEELDSVNHKMVLKGNGMDAKGQGSADMVMHGILSEKDGKTEVDYKMDVTITGKLAQFGARLITDVTNQVAKQFIQSFKDRLAEAEAAAASSNPVAAGAAAVSGGGSTVATPVAEASAAPQENSINAFALMWAVIKGWFARLFGGSSS